MILSKRCFVGFDGFIDTICHVVQSRAEDTYERYSTLGDWSKQVALASGRSANFELEVIEERLGGNAMIFAKALTTLGHRVDWACNVGSSQNHSEPHPVFQNLCNNCPKWANLGQAGQTQALEFLDGKLLMGIQGKSSNMDLAWIEHHLGNDWVQTWLWPCDLVAIVNWTMTLNMGKIWRRIAEVGFPSCKQPFMIIDLADPRKREQEQLRSDLYTLDLLRTSTKLVLSLNRSEAEQVAVCLGGTITSELDNLAKEIHKKLPWFAIVIHDIGTCSLASQRLTLQIESPWVENPKITTGGGDHFNAGLAHALLQNYTLKDALHFAGCYASEFVRTGISPSTAFSPISYK